MEDYLFKIIYWFTVVNNVISVLEMSFHEGV